MAMEPNYGQLAYSRKLAFYRLEVYGYDEGQTT